MNSEIRFSEKPGGPFRKSRRPVQEIVAARAGNLGSPLPEIRAARSGKLGQPASTRQGAPVSCQAAAKCRQAAPGSRQASHQAVAPGTPSGYVAVLHTGDLARRKVVDGGVK